MKIYYEQCLFDIIQNTFTLLTESKVTKFYRITNDLCKEFIPFPLQKTLRSFSPKHHEVFLKTLDVFENSS